MATPFTDKGAAVLFEVFDQLVSFHQKLNDMVWVIIFLVMPFLTVALISSNTRFTASARFSFASSMVSPWVFIPCISCTYAINPPSLQGSKTAVISMFFITYFLQS